MFQSYTEHEIISDEQFGFSCHLVDDDFTVDWVDYIYGSVSLVQRLIEIYSERKLDVAVNVIRLFQFGLSENWNESVIAHELKQWYMAPYREEVAKYLVLL